MTSRQGVTLDRGTGRTDSVNGEAGSNRESPTALSIRRPGSCREGIVFGLGLIAFLREPGWERR